MRVGLRQRVALWFAALVIGSGVIVVLLVVVMSGRFLKERNDALRGQATPTAQGQGPRAGQDARAGQGAAGQGAPAGRGQGPSGGSGGGGAPTGPTDEQRQRDELGRRAADEAFRDVRTLGLATVAGLSVVAIGIAWLVAGRILRPVRTMTDTARSIAADPRLDRRLELEGSGGGARRDELTDLAESFDGMLDRLQTVFEAQRAFVADASHELRTPIAVMTAEVDVALDQPDVPDEELRAALVAIGEELEATTDLVDAMLALARAEALAGVTEVDLAEAAREAVERLPAALADRSGDTLLDPTVAVGDRVLLGRLVANLVGNAATYNHPGGTVAVTTREADGRAVLVVENDGPLVPPDAVSGLFARFARQGQSGSGHGLGLAIVDAIVTTHGGTLVATARPAGGLRVEVSLAAAHLDGRPADDAPTSPA